MHGAGWRERLAWWVRVRHHARMTEGEMISKPNGTGPDEPTARKLAETAGASLSMLGGDDLRDLSDEDLLHIVQMAIEDVQAMVRHPEVDTHTRTDEELKEHMRGFARVVRDRLAWLREHQKAVFGRFSLYQGTVPGASIVGAGGMMAQKIKGTMSLEELLEAAIAVHYVGYVDAQHEDRDAGSATAETVFQAEGLSPAQKTAQERYIDGMLVSLVELCNELGWRTTGVKASAVTLPRMLLSHMQEATSDEHMLGVLRAQGIAKDVAWVGRIFPPSIRLQLLIANPRDFDTAFIAIARIRINLEDPTWVSERIAEARSRVTHRPADEPYIEDAVRRALVYRMAGDSWAHKTVSTMSAHIAVLYERAASWYDDDIRTQKLQMHGLTLVGAVRAFPVAYLVPILSRPAVYQTLSDAVRGRSKAFEQPKRARLRNYFIVGPEGDQETGEAERTHE